MVWIEKLTFCPSLPKDRDCEGITENLGEMYLGKKTIATYVFFILENIRIYCQMDAGEFDGLLYTILSKELFNNQIFHMKDETDNYTIFNYVSQHSRMIFEETMTCLTCHG